jgi:hypothetical protein
MKNLIYCILLLSVGCHCGSKKKSLYHNQIQKQTNENVSENVSSFTYPFSEHPQIFRLKKNKPTQIVTQKGVKIKISASSLEHEDGTPVKGKVVLRVAEVFDKKDFVLQNCQTVSDGRLLISGGSLNIQAFEGNRELQLKKDKSYQIEVPVQTAQAMDLFEGTRDELGNMNWKPIGQKLEIAKNVTDPVVQKNQQEKSTEEPDDTQVTRERKLLNVQEDVGISISAEDFKSYAGITIGGNGYDFNTITPKESRKEARKQKRINRKKEKEVKLYYKPVEVGRLGWINIDAFIKEGRVTDGFKLRFSKGAPGMFGTYLIFNNLNSTIASIKKCESGRGEVWMRNQLPVGERVKIIIYTRRDDEIWHYKADTIITKDLVIEPIFTKAKLADFEKVVIN